MTTNQQNGKRIITEINTEDLKISANDIINIIKDEIPFDDMVLNVGFYETKTLGDTYISIAVAYEEDEESGEVGYCYNLFALDDRIDFGFVPKKDKLPSVDMLSRMLFEIKSLIKANCHKF